MTTEWTEQTHNLRHIRRQCDAVRSNVSRRALDNLSFRDMVALANAKLAKTWALHSATWRFGNQESVKVNPKYGELSFFFGGGEVVTAPAQLIGTYDRTTYRFRWAWADEEFAGTTLTAVAESMSRFGAKRRWKPFTEPTVECSHRIAWDFNSLGFLLAHADGAFESAVDEDTFRYFIFSAPNVRHPPADRAAEDAAPE